MKKNRYEVLKLDHQLCFALYAATRTVTRTYREKLSALGLTYPQYLVLTVLWEQNGCNLTSIGKSLLLDSGTLTPLVKRLEAMGLVTRKRRFKDEREIEVWLTDKGMELREHAVGVREHVQCRLAMSDKEIADMRADLMALIERIGPEMEMAEIENASA